MSQLQSRGFVAASAHVGLATMMNAAPIGHGGSGVYSNQALVAETRRRQDEHNTAIKHNFRRKRSDFFKKGG